MRFILGLFLVVAVVLYATIGIRIGFLPDLALTVFNAKGTNAYPLEIYNPRVTLDLNLASKLSGGEITVELVTPSGNFVWQRRIQPGQDVRDDQKFFIAQPGPYKIYVNFEHATGRIDLNWFIEGTYR